MVFQHKNDLVGVFAQHKVAANLLMVMMILAGIFGLLRLNTQFFPNFPLQFVSVRVTWTGASAEDVESLITIPIEQELRTVDELRKMTSTSAEGISAITLEYEEGADMGEALDTVKEQVSLVRNLPANAEEPEISRIIRYESIARVLITGPARSHELRALAHQFEHELLDRGIAKVELRGLPEDEIAIQVPTKALRELDMSLDQVADRVASLSRDMPAGTIGRNQVARQLRALQQRRRETGFEQLPLVSEESGRLVSLGDIATIERRPRSRQTRVMFRGKPAVELRALRAEGGDSLGSARVLEEWLADVRPRLPAGVELYVYDQRWQFIRDRINLLLKNGAGGLVLVVAILFLFLNGRVAWWVAIGIPVSFMATLGILYVLGGSINMLSLFALIMTLGIIVDDAIVVGEDALTHYQRGEEPLQSAEGGARRMLAPVISSSLTTVAAFLPLMLISGIIGNILFAIPLVVICVILASLVESFLVLPGHLRGSFRGLHGHATNPLRIRLDRGFERFREGVFRPLVRGAVFNPAVTVSTALAMLLVAAGLVVGGRLPFNFFPTPEGTVINANVGFVAGTPPARVQAFVGELESSLYELETEFGEPLVQAAVVRLGRTSARDGRSSETGDQFASIVVELVEPDLRSVRNPRIVEAWRQTTRLPPGLESFAITEERAGPPGRDLEIRITGDDPAQLKAASLDLTDTLSTVAGVTGVDDDMPFGQEQLIYSLTQEGQSLGLTVESVGRQLRAAYDGRVAQIFQDGDDEIEVRIVLPDEERYDIASLDDLGIVLPSGRSVPLLSMVEINTRRGFEILRHAEGNLAVQVSADVDPAITKSNKVIESLERDVLPALVERYGIDYSYEGRTADQEETLADMRLGGIYALMMIYLVLAWVFASYGWPLVVMAAIPFGLIGALAGHWLLGIDLTILSLFGFFGLSGIVVNDSIILVTFYKGLRANGMAIREAIIEASCQRLRAVLLTSLTTIAGLIPLLFETSLQAQFLIPMAVSISYGLAFATVLVLLVIPALLIIHENIAERLFGPMHVEQPA